MRRLFFSLVSLILSTSAITAYASTVPAGTYSLTDVNVVGDTLSGTMTFDSSGSVAEANLTFNDSAVSTPNFTTVGSKGTSGYPNENYVFITGPYGQVALFYSQILTASQGISLCVYGSSCQSYQGSYLEIYMPSGFNGSGMAYLSGGTLDSISTSVTPEPSSLVLMGTGLLGAAAALQRKLSKGLS